LETEHPSGAEYATYLTKVAKHFKVPVKTKVEVKNVRKDNDIFEVETSDGTYSCRILIWAAGEFSYPNTPSFEGSEYCTHYSSIRSFEDIKGCEVVVIGGYESGMDALIELSKLGKKVTVIDRGEPWDLKTSDSSISLAPYTIDKLKNVFPKEVSGLVGNQEVTKVVKVKDGYRVFTKNGDSHFSDSSPILATGFTGSTSLIKDLFEWDEENLKPNLSNDDESTITPGLFLVGPEVRHSAVIFCFVYKYRQRFPVVVKALMKRLKKKCVIPEEYNQDGVLLEDLSCCLNECSC
jgi:thioredoxin reductase